MATQFTRYMWTVSFTWPFVTCLLILVVYIIALCSFLNTTTFFLFHVFFLVHPHPTQNLPLPTPRPTIFPDTAEDNGRYSEGSHTRFCETRLIHTLFTLKARSRFSNAATDRKGRRSDGPMILMGPMFVWRYKPELSNEMWSSDLPTLSVCRHTSLLAFQILTVMNGL